MSRRRRLPWIKNQRAALLLGLSLSLGGLLVLRDAYEDRGKPRPAWLSFVPGA